MATKDDFLKELEGQKLSALKKRAREEGVSVDEIEEVDDADDPKEAVIELIMSKKYPKDEDPKDEDESLREELHHLKLSQLKKLANRVGASQEQLDEVDDDENPKMKCVDLICSKQKATNPEERAAFKTYMDSVDLVASRGKSFVVVTRPSVTAASVAAAATSAAEAIVNGTSSGSGTAATVAAAATAAADGNAYPPQIDRGAKPRPLDCTDGQADALKRVFRNADQNGDGIITKEELTQLFKAEQWSEIEIQEMFNIVDKNGDGMIQYEEFVDWMMAGEEDPKQAQSLSKASSNGVDSHLDPPEVVLHSPQRFRSILYKSAGVGTLDKMATLVEHPAESF